MSDKKTGPTGDRAELVVFDVVAATTSGAIGMLNPAMGVVVAAAVPAAKKMLQMCLVAADSRRARAERRLAHLVVGAGFSEDDLNGSFEEQLEDEESMLMAAVEGAIADDEAAKAWAYGALIRGFHDGTVKLEDRARWLRFVKSVFNADLIAVVNAGQACSKCRYFWDGGVNTDRLNNVLAEHGFDDNKQVAWYEQVRIVNEVVRGNPHIRQQLQQFGFLSEHPAFEPVFFFGIYPVLLAGAERAGFADKPSTEAEFFARMIEARRDREPVPPELRHASHESWPATEGAEKSDD